MGRAASRVRVGGIDATERRVPRVGEERRSVPAHVLTGAPDAVRSVRHGTLGGRRPVTESPPGSMTALANPNRIAAWRTQWGPITPLLVAEFVVWLGFGGLLPVLPIYFTEQGVDLATLGIVIAAWPAARLVSEPIFG